MPLNLIGEGPRDCESAMKRCRTYMVPMRSTSGATSPEAADADADADALTSIECAAHFAAHHARWAGGGSWRGSCCCATSCATNAAGREQRELSATKRAAARTPTLSPSAR
jgi:hypothetical protein